MVSRGEHSSMVLHTDEGAREEGLIPCLRY